jgi:hypothetical protein
MTTQSPRRFALSAMLAVVAFLLPPGSNDPINPSTPGWGGHYRRADEGWFRDDRLSTTGSRETVDCWRPDLPQDFARRMVWDRDR